MSKVKLINKVSNFAITNEKNIERFSILYVFCQDR